MYSSPIFPKKPANTTYMNNIQKSTPTEKLGGRNLRNDIILILTLLIVVGALGLGFWLFRPNGDVVEVRVDGNVVGTYSLTEELTLDIAGVGGINRMVITGGKVHVEYADCPDGICAGHHAISRSGESIVCLPHRVVLTVRSTSPDSEAPDIVA